MQFNLDSWDDTVLIVIDEQILGETLVNDLVEKVIRFIDLGKTNFIVDMTHLKSMNSIGISGFISCLLKARKKGGNFVLVNIPEFIMDLLGITHLLPAFTIAETIEQAKAIFKANKV